MRVWLDMNTFIVMDLGFRATTRIILRSDEVIGFEEDHDNPMGFTIHLRNSAPIVTKSRNRSDVIDQAILQLGWE